MAPKPTRNPREWRLRPADAPDTGRNGEPLGRIEFLCDQDQWVPAGHLRYSERDAWRLVFPGTPAPSTWSTAQASLVAFTGADDEDPPKVPEVPPAKVETVPVPPAATGDPLVDAIRSAIADAAAGAMDADAVRSLIQEELRNMPAPVVQVTLPEQDPIEIEGTTHHLFERALQASWAGMNLFLTGAPGTGKTTLAQQVAQAMGVDFRHMSCHPQMTGVSLFGYNDAQGRYVSTDFRHCYENGHLFLLDEADNGNGGIIAALNAAIENGHCSFPDGMVKRHADFRIMVAANTFGTGATAEFAGRNKLDPATLNRFVYLHVGIDEKVEEAMVLAECDPSDTKSVQAGTAWLAKVRTCRANADAANLRPRVFITPRDARDGARLIRLGWTPADAANAKFLAAVDDTARAKITQGVRF